MINKNFGLVEIFECKNTKIVLYPNSLFRINI